MVALIRAALLISPSHFFSMTLILSTPLFLHPSLLLETMLLWGCPTVRLRAASERGRRATVTHIMN
jgi:hypothetical protein